MATALSEAGEGGNGDFFGDLPIEAPDSLLNLIKLAKADGRDTKIDLGVGVYRDAGGGTPILRAVKEAERLLWERQDTKAYLGPEGDLAFVGHVRRLLLGERLAGDDRIVGVQTPGGCGAVRLAAELVRVANPDARVIVGRPTWPNHEPLIGATGLELVDYLYYDPAHARLNLDAMLDAFRAARAGDVVLLQGSCHNPAGADLSPEQWEQVADLVVARGLVPLVDIAYQGLGDGLEPDAAGTRLMVERCPVALIAQSCDKNFGLYRERAGSLFVKAESAKQAAAVFGNLLGLGRRMWSMPPDHGAALVRMVFEEPDLEADWRAELDRMGARIRELRARLAQQDERLAYIAGQKGMFSILPLTPDAVGRLQAEHGVYMARSGRINVAGFAGHEIPRFVDAIRPHLPETV